MNAPGTASQTVPARASRGLSRHCVTATRNREQDRGTGRAAVAGSRCPACSPQTGFGSRGRGVLMDGDPSRPSRAPGSSGRGQGPWWEGLSVARSPLPESGPCSVSEADAVDKQQTWASTVTAVHRGLICRHFCTTSPRPLFMSHRPARPGLIQDTF